MAVAILRTDDWLQHLLFTGPPRPTPYGPVDGLAYGTISGLGDASAGNLTLNGRLSFERKEDWVYIFGGLSLTSNSGTAFGDSFTQVNTGPVTPTNSAVVNPTFNRGGTSDAISANNVTITDNYNGGPDYRQGLPIFGDKRLAGIFLMVAAGVQINEDGATYTLSFWSWIVKYSSFFRGVAPGLG